MHFKIKNLLQTIFVVNSPFIVTSESVIVSVGNKFSVVYGTDVTLSLVILVKAGVMFGPGVDKLISLIEVTVAKVKAFD